MVRKALTIVNGVPTHLPGGDVLFGTVAFGTVTNYDAMVALGTPGVLTIVRVSTDGDKGLTNTEYHLWPDGTRTYDNVLDDRFVDYTSLGSMVSDGGGPWANDYSQSADKVFDQNISTYYRSNNQNPWVGRNLNAAKKVSQIVLTPIQSQEASYLNGSQVQYSTDGSNWVNIGSAISGYTSTNYATPTTVTFTPTVAQYWRIQLMNYGWLAEMKIQLIRS